MPTVVVDEELRRRRILAYLLANPEGASSFDPATPGAVGTLVAHYDFSDISTLWQDTARSSPITADGQVIKGVTDKSTTGAHLSEATNGPAYKVGVQNGRSASLWDGTNDILGGTLTQAQPFTLFAVVYSTETVASQKTIIDDTSVGTPMWQIRPELPGAGLSCQRMSGGTLGTGTYDWRNRWTAGMAIFNGASSKAYAAGGAADIATYNGGATGFADAFTLSKATQFFKGHMGEVAVYSGALSTTNLDILGAYAVAKWGVTWAAAV